MTDYEDRMSGLADWETLSLWQKFTDNDPRRPAKTWKNRIFWTWPIHTMKGGRIPRTAPRVEHKLEDNNNLHYLQIRTTNFNEPTYENKLCSNYYRIYWYGWMWGWK